MNNILLAAVVAGLSLPLLLADAPRAAQTASDPAAMNIAQSSTETGQSGVGVRGTTGGNSGGGQTAPGSAGTAPGGGSGATGTEGQPSGDGGAGARGSETGPSGATTMDRMPGGMENHVREALKHAEAAAAAGMKGDASTIAQHARMSQTHVEAALKEKPDNEHLKAAEKSISDAIQQASISNADKARKSAREAVSHLSAAK